MTRDADGQQPWRFNLLFTSVFAVPRSNRVLAHLPYLIALDHAKRAVVLAIR